MPPPTKFSRHRISGCISSDVSSLRKPFHWWRRIGSTTAKYACWVTAQPKSYPEIDKHSQYPDFYGQGWPVLHNRRKQQGLRVSSFSILDQRIDDGGHEGCRLIKTTCGVCAPRKAQALINDEHHNVRNRACSQTRFESLASLGRLLRVGWLARLWHFGIDTSITGFGPWTSWEDPIG